MTTPNAKPRASDILAEHGDLLALEGAEMIQKLKDEMKPRAGEQSGKTAQDQAKGYPTELRSSQGNHTQGPWHTHDGLVFFPDNAGGFSLQSCPKPKANARRIVAAVNACEGVPIDELEELAALKCDVPGLAGVAQMAIVNSEHNDKYDALAAQNRELVEALSNLTGWADSVRSRVGVQMGDANTGALIRAHDLLAKHRHYVRNVPK